VVYEEGDSYELPGPRHRLRENGSTSSP
jgi:hypothetical protein